MNLLPLKIRYGSSLALRHYEMPQTDSAFSAEWKAPHFLETIMGYEEGWGPVAGCLSDFPRNPGKNWIEFFPRNLSKPLKITSLEQGMLSGFQW